MNYRQTMTKKSVPRVFASCALAIAILSGSMAWARGTEAKRLEMPPQADGDIAAFLGAPDFSKMEIFDGGRFPCILVNPDGTVLAFFRDRLRRSADGGDSWGETIELPGMQAAIVDDATGRITRFRYGRGVFRSDDGGKTWRLDQEVAFKPNALGHVLTNTHGAESGVTLRFGEHKGRLLQAGRYVPSRDDWPNHYNAAIYSDDGGRTWNASMPFPAMGTGEGALAELSDGRIYYNSRRHWAPEGDIVRKRHAAWSDDGGETWHGHSVCAALPDGMRGTDYGCMGGLVRLPVAGRDILVFSNLDADGGEGRARGRKNMTAWVSFDGGQTWPIKRLVFDGPSAYSSLAAGRPGTPSEGWIYLLFEGGEHQSAGGHVARFKLSWLLKGEATGDGKAPEWIARAAAEERLADRPLAKIAMEDAFWAARRLAAWNLAEQDALAVLAMYDANPKIRRAAVDNLADRKLLAMIALDDSSESVRRAAAENLAGGRLGRHLWQERQEFAARLAGNEPLAAMVLDRDERLDVRLEALANIASQSALEAIAAEDGDPQIRYAAFQRLEGKERRLGAALARDGAKVPKLEFPVKVDGDLSEWEGAPGLPLALNAPERGLNAIARLGWDGEHLLLAVAVEDEKHFNAKQGARIWDGDCLQFAFDPVREKTEPFNLGVALASERVQAHQWMGPEENVLLQGEYAVSRDDQKGMTTYEVKIPIKSLIAAPAKGAVFGFNAVVFNDEDGEGHDYWIGLSPGLAGGLDPAQYRLFILW